MARPKAKEPTERELEIMRVIWEDGEVTVQHVRDRLAGEGRDLAYTTVATLIKILTEKKFLKQTNSDRPFYFVATRTFSEVSGNIVSDIVTRVFGGSRKQLLVQLMEQKKLTKEEREFLKQILRKDQP